jgi:hypothetical protein
MTEPKETSGKLPRPFQFGLKQLLMLPFALGLFLGLYIWRYPFSNTAIPFMLVALLLFARFFRNSVAAIIMSGVIFLIVSAMEEGCTDPREYWRRSMCNNHIRQVTLALQSYEYKHGHFPPAYIADKDGRPMHSWRVLILPYMDHDDIYQQYRMDEPWDGPNNRKLWRVRIPEYECPEQNDNGNPTTSYVAVAGPETVWHGTKPVSIEEISDDRTNTIMVVEMANSGIRWMEPRDLDFSTLQLKINPKEGVGISSLHRDVSWLRSLLGAYVGMADGSVRFLPTDYPPENIKAMLTIGGGENVGEDEP